MEQIGNYYVLNHLTLFTGLTERTLRNYIAVGLLEGEKINGMWHFTPEQVERFICHPAVRPSILAKQNAIVYDFLLENHKNACETCIILDVPGSDKKTLAEFFCRRISDGNYQNIHFAFDGVGQVPRVILRGEAGEVLRLVNEYMERSQATAP